MRSAPPCPAVRRSRSIAFTAHAMVGDRERALAGRVRRLPQQAHRLLHVRGARRGPAAVKRPQARPSSSSTTSRPTALAAAQAPDPPRLRRCRGRVDGAGALAAVEEHEPDLVCLDVMMPRPDGVEVCQRLRSQPRHAGLPILLLTALDRPEDRARGPRGGRQRFPLQAVRRDRAHREASLAAADEGAAGSARPTSSASTSARASRPRPFGIRCRVSLGGDRRHATALFADVRGYTALASEHPPEVILDLLNSYLTVVMDAVEPRAAPWPISWATASSPSSAPPSCHSDDPARAVRAALAMQDAVASPRDPDRCPAFASRPESASPPARSSPAISAPSVACTTPSWARR